VLIPAGLFLEDKKKSVLKTSSSIFTGKRGFFVFTVQLKIK
jgi:hypothetical protein